MSDEQNNGFPPAEPEKIGGDAPEQETEEGSVPEQAAPGELDPAQAAPGVPAEGMGEGEKHPEEPQMPSGELPPDGFVQEAPQEAPEGAEPPVPEIREPEYPQTPAEPYTEPLRAVQETSPQYYAAQQQIQQGVQPQPPQFQPFQPAAQPQQAGAPVGGPVYDAAPVWQAAPPAYPAAPGGVPMGTPGAAYTAQCVSGAYPAAPVPPMAPPPQGYGQTAAGQVPAAQMPFQPPFQPAVQPPQAGYYAAPPAYGAYGAYGMPVPPQPPRRKKLSLPLKVFLWIASILAAGAVLGFSAYLIYSASTSSGPWYSQLPSDQYPIYPFEDEDPGDEGPDFGVTPPEDDEDDSKKPDVDVTPNTDGITIHERPEGKELDAQAAYDKVAKSTVTVSAALKKDGQEADSTGTGIIATSDGYIITNSHVVLNSKSTTVKVTTYDGEEYDAVVVGVDRTSDLAVLKTNDHAFTPAEFGDAEELSIGEWVLAIGNPGGARFSSSLTRGIVSGLNREVGQYSENGMTYIQTDAAINPGNSGGPLVNMYGQVVGINSSKIITEGYEGMGFAIPVSRAQPIINELLSGGYVKGRTRLGISGYEVSAAMAAMGGVPQGFLISEINKESSFNGTDAKVNDIITAVDGETVTSLNDLSNLLLKYSPGDKVTVKLYRMNEKDMAKGEELEVEITLLEDKGETQN